jgi:DNA-directed RNA polymerase subunit M/transcription elongation factor TFIIS
MERGRNTHKISNEARKKIPKNNRREANQNTTNILKQERKEEEEKGKKKETKAIALTGCLRRAEIEEPTQGRVEDEESLLEQFNHSLGCKNRWRVFN